MAYETIWHHLYSDPDPELPVSGQNKSKISGIKGYYYEEMIKRLNNVDKGIVGSVGYFLRRLWKKYESRLTVHKADVYSEWHEQRQKASKAEFEKNFKKKEIGFDKDGNIWGVYTDLFYDTYKKDWTKAYQYTFHEFFHNIDYLANSTDDSFFTYTCKSRFFEFIVPGAKNDRGFARDKECQFGEIIKTDIAQIENKIKTIEKLSKHDKAPLYDIIGGANNQEKHTDDNGESFGHDPEYWAKVSRNDFPKLLAVETFAHMAATAIVNRNAFNAMKEYLPNSYRMFVEILKQMVGI